MDPRLILDEDLAKLVLRNAWQIVGDVWRHLHCRQTPSVPFAAGDDYNRARRLRRRRAHRLRTSRAANWNSVGRTRHRPVCRIDHLLTGDLYRPTRITFPRSPASSSNVYAEHLGLTPDFRAPIASVCIDRRELSSPLKTANPQLHAIVERYIELNGPAPGPRYGAARAPGGGPDHAPWQRQHRGRGNLLSMHPRTLQRRLTVEGATFEKVRDDVRRHMAEIYLANEVVSLAHVAHLLGYANQSVLTRSCLRWFGKTPLAMRQHVTGRGR